MDRDFFQNLTKDVHRLYCKTSDKRIESVFLRLAAASFANPYDQKSFFDSFILNTALTQYLNKNFGENVIKVLNRIYKPDVKSFGLDKGKKSKGEESKKYPGISGVALYETFKLDGLLIVSAIYDLILHGDKRWGSIFPDIRETYIAMQNRYVLPVDMSQVEQYKKILTSLMETYETYVQSGYTVSSILYQDKTDGFGFERIQVDKAILGGVISTFAKNFARDLNMSIDGGKKSSISPQTVMHPQLLQQHIGLGGLLDNPAIDRMSWQTANQLLQMVLKYVHNKVDPEIIYTKTKNAIFSEMGFVFTDTENEETGQSLMDKGMKILNEYDTADIEDVKHPSTSSVAPVAPEEVEEVATKASLNFPIKVLSVTQKQLREEEKQKVSLIKSSMFAPTMSYLIHAMIEHFYELSAQEAKEEETRFDKKTIF